MKIEEPIWALGAMSGTSLDGVDAALVRTDGVSIFEFGETAYLGYSDAERQVLRAALGKWPGEQNVHAAAEIVEARHAELLQQFQADVVGFPGQTLAHDPGGLGTHQTGNGAVLAEFLQCPVVWDFRSADVEMGGQGAPLAPFYHFALAQFLNFAEPVVFLNLGGVGNVTWVDPNFDAPEKPGACLAFDTGPANAPINDLMQMRLGKSHDENGELAAQGQADLNVLHSFLQHPYFFKSPPKSLDRNDFDDLLVKVQDLSDADAAATLTSAAVAAVVHGVAQCPSKPSKILVAGGGRKNPAIMAGLVAGLTSDVYPVEDFGLDGDMLEAQAFAYLAVRVLRGLPTSAPSTTGVGAAIGGGNIARPGSFG